MKFFIYAILMSCVFMCNTLTLEKDEDQARWKRSSSASSCAARDFAGLDPKTADHCFSNSNQCDPNEKYRSLDGSCNNVKHPTWGNAYTNFIRRVQNSYLDGKHQPEENKSGDDEKNVRKCRLNLLKSSNNNPDPKFSINMVAIGQFCAHDIINSHRLAADCCPVETENTGKCYSIGISAADGFYKDKDFSCIKMVRSARTDDDGCSVSTGDEQINEVSHFIDGSPIFGSDDTTWQSMKNQDGSLKTQIINGQHYLPNADDPDKYCNLASEDCKYCFTGGDSRVNQNPHLTTLHVVFLREFNRVFQALQEINPHWDSDRLHQETRKIVVAQVQKIVVYDWLPFAIGDKAMQDCELAKPKAGAKTRYDPDLHPGIMNEVSTAAMRIFHDLIPSQIELFFSYDYRNSDDKVFLGDYFNRVGCFIPDNFDNIIRSLNFQKCEKSDSQFVDDITQFLFKDNKRFGPKEKDEKGYGDDLVSIDWQRGRDHGLAKWNDVREYCGLNRISSFEELANDFGESTVEILEECFDDVDQIDLFVGITRLEERVGDALAGPTAICLLGEQFRRLKVGDRWWFDGEANPANFTKAQLTEIHKKTNLAKIFCNNGNNIEKTQRNIWLVPDENENPLVSCESLPNLDLEAWRESSGS